MKRATERVAIGCTAIDKMLGGGLPIGCLSLIYGQAATGKTTLAMQAAVECGRRGRKTIFVDCDRSFTYQRLAQIANVNVEKVSENVLVFLPETFVEQSSLVENVENYVTKRLLLIVIDSVTSLYRASFRSVQSIFALNRELNRQLAYLAQVASERGLVILLTSQVHSQLASEEAKVEPVARRILLYWSSVVVNLRPTVRRNVKLAVLEKHLSRENTNLRSYLTLTERGLTGC